MKVGILTFSRAINFGANLQACSTYCYLKNHGYEPIFINYVAEESVDEGKSFPSEQVKVQREFQNQFAFTEHCHDGKTVAEVLIKHGIHNVIIGSDAVAQHHPKSTRIVFPTRHIITISHPSSDKLFPNPFWGDFLDYIEDPISVSLMSVSNQQSKYSSFTKSEMKEMIKYVSRFSFISVRDDWTQSMYERISNGKIVPDVTPDPVFAFNMNVSFIPSKEEILRKYELPNNYILLALHNGRTVAPSWVKSFERCCEEQGYTCVAFPFPYGINKNNVAKKRINLPLSPIEWYALIKFSKGYVGYNMHTIVSALHNSVPCFCMDQYGRRVLGQFINKRSSKIFHILNAAGFPENRVTANTVIDFIPSPQKVFNMLMQFDREKCKRFADYYYERYLKMMSQIEDVFIKQ